MNAEILFEGKIEIQHELHKDDVTRVSGYILDPEKTVRDLLQKASKNGFIESKDILEFVDEDDVRQYAKSTLNMVDAE